MANSTYTPKRTIGTNAGYMCAIAFAVVVLIALQYQYWHGEYGHANLEALKIKLQEQQRLNESQIYANSILLADVQDLKSGLSAIEEHARLDLGLIKPGETFIQLSNAPITYSRQPLPSTTESLESVDSVPELEPSATKPSTTGN